MRGGGGGGVVWGVGGEVLQCVCVCFHVILCVNCFSRTVLSLCIEYCV